MEQASSNKRTAARIMFITAGLCAILLFLLWNPLVLRPRSWSAAVVVRSLSIDAALLLIGVGLIRLRRWATLLASVVAVYIAIDFEIRRGGLGLPLALGLLIPLLFTGVFWRDLVWGDKRRDLLLVLASLLVSGVCHYAAFMLRPA
jgi:amino acid transporter